MNMMMMMVVVIPEQVLEFPGQLWKCAKMESRKVFQPPLTAPKLGGSDFLFSMHC